MAITVRNRVSVILATAPFWIWLVLSWVWVYYKPTLGILDWLAVICLNGALVCGGLVVARAVTRERY